MTKTSNMNQRLQVEGQTVADRINCLEQAASYGSTALLDLLPTALADRSPTVRDKAVLLVMAKGLNQAVRFVEPLLHDRSEDVRYDAAECVGIVGKSGVPNHGLRALLLDKSALVRAQAAESLGLIADKGALPTIARLLKDKVPFVRSYGASAIGVLGGSAYIKRIHRALRNEPNDQARVGLLGALFALGEGGVLQSLLGFLESSDYRVRCATANTLEVLSLKAPEILLAVAALKKASRKSLAVADRTAAKRVLRTLKKRV